ncbi:MAG TPA: formylglycine-generating enzyme family protein, partial [Longimicrobium sp.]|nr:formylglycine-generating enzyme family protein [Longimicrobium sp.]
RALTLALLLCLTAICAAAAPVPGPGMARIPGGSYTPLFINGRPSVRVDAFALDRHPVTRAEYLAFVRAQPRWQRGRVARALAGPGYLASWPGPLAVGTGVDARRPVTEVSWFAARAFCTWRGARLPTTDEWEYAALASETVRNASRDAVFISRLLELYRTPRPVPPVVGSGFRNAYGVHDLHGVVWEWVLDFNSVLVSDDSRATSGRDHSLFCAAGVVGATDPGNYPAFLRYGFRAALQGRTTVGSLGFRCAQDL